MKTLTGLACAVAFSAHALATTADESAVDQLFAAYAKTGSPGCSLGIVQDGAFIYSKGYGLGSLELGVPLSPSSVFYMASVSKQFTAASVVLAAEQGLLSLDDDVHKFIPELPNYGHAITLRQMLHHTSGFRDFLGLLELSGRHIVDVHSSPELIDLIARQKALNYIPGSEFLYSNTNYFLLAEIIKRVSHKSLSVFAEENIFRPLGMSHTRFYDDREVVVPGRVPAYALASSGYQVDWSTNFDAVGDGGLMSSVEDLLLWDRNFYDNRLGKGTLVKEMVTRGVLNDGKQIEYALGLQVSSYHGLPTVDHGGALFGYRTEILRFPEQRFSVICLCNLGSANPGALARNVADVFLKTTAPSPAKQLAKETPEKTPGGEARALQGKYENLKEHSAFRFTVADNALQAFGMSLKRTGHNQFLTPVGPTVVFEAMNGKTSVSVKNGEQVIFEGVRVEELHLSDADLQAYTGEYTSAELAANYKFFVEGGRLMLRNGWNSPEALEALGPDEFVMGQVGTAVFHRDSTGKVAGLSVYSGRIRDVRFDRKT